MALRILLHSLSTSAARYRRYIVPTISCGIDFYIRVFVRVHESAAEVTKFKKKKKKEKCSIPTSMSTSAGSITYLRILNIESSLLSCKKKSRTQALYRFRLLSSVFLAINLHAGQKHLPENGLRVSVRAVPELPFAARGHLERSLVPRQRAARGFVGQMPGDQRGPAAGRAHVAQPPSRPRRRPGNDPRECLMGDNCSPSHYTSYFKKDNYSCHNLRPTLVYFFFLSILFDQFSFP